MEHDEAEILARDDGIELLEHRVDAADLVSEVAVGVDEVHAVLVDEQARVIPEVRLAVQER